MKTLRPTTLALLVLLFAGAAVAAEPYADLMREAGDALGDRRPPAIERFAALREALGALPRENLTDDEWLDLHVVLSAIDRRMNPAPRPVPAGGTEFALPPANWPPVEALAVNADPVDLLDIAAQARAFAPPPGAAVYEPNRELWSAAAERARAFAVAADALETQDPVLAAATAVAADATRDLAFDLSCENRSLRPGGKERFEWLLLREHGLAFDIDQVREIGEAARTRILADLVETAGRIDPRRTWTELTEMGRATHPASTEELFTFVQKATAEAMATAVSSGLVSIPESARQPGFVLLERIRPQFPTPYACYGAQGMKDGIYRGNFVITAVPPDLTDREREQWLRGRDSHWIRVVCGHEAVPGHHLQYARAAEIESSFRHFGHTSVYVEGWGLYSEDLMDRAGAFADPLDRLALLRMRLWRAIRVLVDVDLHTGTLRPSEAVRRLTDEVRMDRWTAEREVERYLVSPTQPLSYLVGYAKIQAIRRAWLAIHGSEAEREFNDRLLGLGPIPLDLAAAFLLGKRTAYDLTHP